MIIKCIAYKDLLLEELYDIMRIRQEVFIVEQDCPYLDADSKDQAAWHLMGYKEGELVAYTRLLPKGVSYEDYLSIGRVVTAEKGRGKGYGVKIMRESILKIKMIFGDQPIKISAQSYLLKFYNDFGFEPTGDEYLEDGIPHTAMILQ